MTPRLRRLCAPCLLAVAACGGSGPSGEPELVVFAAASTTDVVSALSGSFEGARVRASFGPSSGLARQIAGGAPADVFVSASRRWMEHLRAGGHLVGEPRAFARNRLVCVALPGAFPGAPPAADARALAARLAPGDRVAIADAGVPAGEYARQALAAAGALEALRPHLVGQDDVRGALRAVTTGQAAAGLVYATDARAARVAVLFELDPATHDAVEYLAAVVRGARDRALAARFVDHLAASVEVLREAGFEPAGEVGG